MKGFRFATISAFIAGIAIGVTIMRIPNNWTMEQLLLSYACIALLSILTFVALFSIKK